MTTKITEKNISSLANAGVNWQSVVVADGSTGLTAVAGRGYFINTTSGAITVTLPTSANVGDVIVLKDYARTWATNNVTIASTLLDGLTNTPSFSTNGQTVTLVYMDNTKGWSLINEDTTTSLAPAIFISATGGTITTSGDFKIHTFTGDGCFVVSQLGNAPENPLGGPSNVDYLVVAGGGSGGGRYGGGGGAGGFREGRVLPAPESYAASPLVVPGGLPVSLTTYPITVGAGGTGVPSAPGSDDGNRGSNSVFSTITSAGGGAGSGQAAFSPLSPGGSGGGGSYGGSAPVAAGGSGNTPPTSPSQGNPGGNGYVPNSPYSTGGGGGATEAGVNATGSPSQAGRGGAGATTSISGSPVGYAGGGGGSGEGDHGVTFGAASPCGSGTAGGSGASPSSNGAANRGGGSGAAYWSSPTCGASSSGNGGKGVVIIRYKFQ